MQKVVCHCSLCNLSLCTVTNFTLLPTKILYKAFLDASAGKIIVELIWLCKEKRKKLANKTIHEE